MKAILTKKNPVIHDGSLVFMRVEVEVTTEELLAELESRRPDCTLCGPHKDSRCMTCLWRGEGIAKNNYMVKSKPCSICKGWRYCDNKCKAFLDWEKKQ
jgi:hypothetical protein